MRKMISAAVAALAVTVAAPATAATQVVDSSGKLTGATGVNIGGVLYDVTFGDGTCAALFGGCDASTDFTFTTQASANLAAQALLDQVLINGPAGQFDDVAQLTNGCFSTSFCGAIIPYAVSGQFSLSAAGNYGPIVGSVHDEVLNFSLNPTDNSVGFNNYTFARFSLASAAVPEPATWAMMLLGFGGIGFAMRRKRALNANHLSQLA